MNIIIIIATSETQELLLD